VPKSAIFRHFFEQNPSKIWKWPKFLLGGREAHTQHPMRTKREARFHVKKKAEKC